MSKEELIGRILAATPEQLARVEAAFTGGTSPEPASYRLLRMGEAAGLVGISRVTLWRAIQDKRLRTVEVRRGSHRIPESELRRFVAGGNLH